MVTGSKRCTFQTLGRQQAIEPHPSGHPVTIFVLSVGYASLSPTQVLGGIVTESVDVAIVGGGPVAWPLPLPQRVDPL